MRRARVLQPPELALNRHDSGRGARSTWAAVMVSSSNSPGRAGAASEFHRCDSANRGGRKSNDSPPRCAYNHPAASAHMHLPSPIPTSRYPTKPSVIALQNASAEATIIQGPNRNQGATLCAYLASSSLGCANPLLLRTDPHWWQRRHGDAGGDARRCGAPNDHRQYCRDGRRARWASCASTTRDVAWHGRTAWAAPACGSSLSPISCNTLAQPL